MRLQIEQGAEEIYSEGYGLAVKDLLGRDYPYVAAELERRIKESLLADDRILAVEDMSLTADGRRVSANFVVKSVYGESEESAKVVL